MSWIVSIIVAGLMTVGISEPTHIAPKAEPEMRSEKVSAQNDQPAAQQQERIDQTYPLNANGRVSLSNVNGDVVIEAWDKTEARVEAVKTVDCEKPLNLEVKIDATPSYLRVETVYPKNENTWISKDSKDGKTWSHGYQNRCREAKVEYKLTLPRTARLDRVETVNGNVTLGGMTDLVKVGTVNGKIVAGNLRGTVNLSSVNGTLDVDVESLENVREIKLGIVNGRIDLKVPSDIDAIVKADTVNGAINNDFGLPVHKGEYVGRNLYGRLGNGGINVKLDGVNGTINIRRKQDGRTPKPATNLLPPNGKDNDNDNDVDVDVDVDVDDGTGVVIRNKPPKPPKPAKLPRAKTAPRAPGIGDAITESILGGINETVVGVVDDTLQVINETTREELRKAIKDAAKVKIDKEKIQREIRESMEKTRESMRETRERMAEARMFAWSYNSTYAPMSDRENASVAVEGTPDVTINAPGGAVSIRGWDKQEVSYSLFKRAINKDTAPKAALQKNGKTVTLNVTATDESPYRIEIFVPRKSNIKVTSERAIRVEGVKGELHLQGDEESIDVRDSSGKLTIAANEGNVRVIGFEGDADVKTACGAISLEGDFKNLATNTIDGNVTLTVKPDFSATLEATTKNILFNNIQPVGNPEDTKNSTIFRFGKGDGANYKMRVTAGGKILVRSADSIRVTRNYIIFADEKAEIFS